MVSDEFISVAEKKAITLRTVQIFQFDQKCIKMLLYYLTTGMEK